MFKEKLPQNWEQSSCQHGQREQFQLYTAILKLNLKKEFPFLFRFLGYVSFLEACYPYLKRDLISLPPQPAHFYSYSDNSAPYRKKVQREESGN